MGQIVGFDCSARSGKCHTLHSIAYPLSLYRWSIHVIPAHARLVPGITHAHSCVAVSHDRTSRRRLLIYSGPPLYIIMTNKAINNHLSLDALYNNVHNDNYITLMSTLSARAPNINKVIAEWYNSTFYITNLKYST